MTSTRLAHIDALRAVAALSVVLWHFSSDIVVLDFVTSINFDFGRFGVLVFFIVSGYVVPFSLLRQRSRPIVTFAISRCFRLYPAYLLSVALIVLLGGASPTFWEILINATLLQKFVGLGDINSVAWTLAIELVFYGGCVGLFLTRALHSLHRLSIVLMALSVLTIAAALTRLWFGVSMPFTWLGFFSLMVGGTVIRRMDDLGKPLDWRFWVVLAGFLLLQLGAIAAIYSDPVHGRPAGREITAWLAAIAIFLLVDRLAPIRWAPIAYVGRISYSLYLFHAPVSSFLLLAAHQANLPDWAVLTLTTALVLGLAAAIYHAVEVPLINLGRRLTAEGQPAPTSVSASQCQ